MDLRKVYNNFGVSNTALHGEIAPTKIVRPIYFSFLKLRLPLEASGGLATRGR